MAPTDLEIWTAAALAAFLEHGVGRFDELPAPVLTELRRLASSVWPALAIIYREIGPAMQTVPDPSAMTQAEMRSVADQLGPELGLGPEQMVQAANGGVAEHLLEVLWAIGSRPSERSPYR